MEMVRGTVPKGVETSPHFIVTGSELTSERDSTFYRRRRTIGYVVRNSTLAAVVNRTGIEEAALRVENGN